MMPQLLWLNVLLVPVIYVGTSPSPIEQVRNKTAVAKVFHKDSENKTNFTLVSEGGSLSPDSSLTLPKQFEILSNLDEELGTKKEKPVARRNGVGLPTLDNNTTMLSDMGSLQTKSTRPELVKNGTFTFSSTKNSTKADKNTISPNQANNSKESNVSETINAVTPNSIKLKKVVKNKTMQHNNTVAVNNTEIHKPLVLSYDSLSNADDQNQIVIPALKASSRTITNDQIPSPNKDKVYPMNSNKHPGMIMPMVITILVVPMFAVLGFLALRRGREAWKNRHYKRMDFLLDGMYND